MMLKLWEVMDSKVQMLGSELGFTGRATSVFNTETLNFLFDIWLFFCFCMRVTHAV